MNEDKLIELLHIQASLSAQLKRLRDEEAAVRREICDHLLAGKEAGTHKFNFGNLTWLNDHFFL